MDCITKAIEKFRNCPPEKILANTIVLQAVQDWQLLAQYRMAETQLCNFAELRQFFLSDWCETLTESGAYILWQLGEYKIEQEKIREEKKNGKHRN